MPESAVCDRCQKNISMNQGYLFYSTAGLSVAGMPMEVGALLLCEGCTDEAVSEVERGEVEAKFTESAFDANQPVAGILQSMAAGTRDANTASIAEAGKRHGLSASQVKARAALLGADWWKDKVLGALTAQLFWTGSIDLQMEVRSKNAILRTLHSVHEVFSEARNGRTRKDDFKPFVSLVNEPPREFLERSENRRAALVEKDRQAEKYNSELMRNYYIQGFALWGGGLLGLILIPTIFIASVHFQRPLLLILVLLILLVTLLVLGLAWEHKKSERFVVLGKQKPFFFDPDGQPGTGPEAANSLCPGCEDKLAVGGTKEIVNAEMEAYRCIAEEVRLQNMAPGLSLVLSTLRICNGTRHRARELARLVHRRSYLCDKCKICFCAACTGGLVVDKRRCPDCGGPMAPAQL